jgi:hypothetical protein
MTAEGAELAQRVDALESLLRQRSEAAWADRLRDAVRGGSSGTEILDRVAVVLRDLERSDAARRAGCASEARALRSLIDRRLRG